MDDVDLGLNLSSDEEETTAAKVLQMLTAAWANEKHSPTLLKVIQNQVRLDFCKYLLFSY